MLHPAAQITLPPLSYQNWNEQNFSSFVLTTCWRYFTFACSSSTRMTSPSLTSDKAATEVTRWQFTGGAHLVVSLADQSHFLCSAEPLAALPFNLQTQDASLTQAATNMFKRLSKVTTLRPECSGARKLEDSCGRFLPGALNKTGSCRRHDFRLDTTVHRKAINLIPFRPPPSPRLKIEASSTPQNHS